MTPRNLKRDTTLALQLVREAQTALASLAPTPQWTPVPTREEEVAAHEKVSQLLGTLEPLLVHMDARTGRRDPSTRGKR